MVDRIAEIKARVETSLSQEDIRKLRTSDIAQYRLDIKYLLSALARKCEHERQAVKCISDIETYLELGSPKYIRKTIDGWRNSI